MTASRGRTAIHPDEYISMRDVCCVLSRNEPLLNMRQSVTTKRTTNCRNQE